MSRPTAPPPVNAEGLRAFLHAVGAALAMAAVSTEAVALPLIPRGPSPTATRAARDQQIAELIPALDRMLSGKTMRPSGPGGTHPAVLGRMAVSNGEILDIANNSYGAGIGLLALVNALRITHNGNRNGGN